MKISKDYLEYWAMLLADLQASVERAAVYEPEMGSYFDDSVCLFRLDKWIQQLEFLVSDMKDQKSVFI